MVGRDGAHALRYAAAGAVAVAVAGLATVSPRGVLYAVVPWFLALGLLRRITSEYAPYGGADPLLAVGPLALGLLAVVALHRGAMRDATPLAKAVVVFSILVLLGALNPLQGSPTAGIASLLFVLVPMFGFFIGRAVGDDALRTFVRLLGLGGLVVAVYGLGQTFYGFLPWDASWIQQQRDYAALGVFTSGGGGAPVTRPFGTASSAAEYGYIVGIALVIWAVGGVTKLRLVNLGVVAILFVALVLESSRGILVATVAGLLFVLAAKRRFSFWPATVAVALTLVALPVALSVASFGTGGATQVGTLVGHQVEGIRDPLNPETSTLGIHLDLIVEGVRSPLVHPLGLGLSAVTIAGQRLGSSVAAGTEADISNVGVALGIPGFLVYFLVLALALPLLYRVARARSDPLGFIGLAIGIILLLQWLNGGMYAVAWLPG